MGSRDVGWMGRVRRPEVSRYSTKYRCSYVHRYCTSHGMGMVLRFWGYLITVPYILARCVELEDVGVE